MTEKRTPTHEPSPEPRRLRLAIRALARRFSLSERAEVSCCGMTVAQAATLEALRAEGPLRLGDLGKRLGIRPSTLTRNLLRLEKRGLVERVGDPGDARAVRARLTESGGGAAREVERQANRFAESVLEQIPPERRTELLEGFEELVGAVLRATEQCCSGAFEHLLELPATASGIERSGQ